MLRARKEGIVFVDTLKPSPIPHQLFLLLACFNTPFQHIQALSYDGHRLAAGAPGENKFFPPVPGYAAVYEQTNSTGPYKQLGDDLEGGYSVSLSFDGSVVAVGSYKGYSNGLSSGQVKTYKLEGDGDDRAFVSVGQDIYGEARSMLGTSVAISSNGMRVASGAPAHVGKNNEMEIGAVQVFELCMD